MTVALVYENRFSFEDSKLLLDPEGGRVGGGTWVNFWSVCAAGLPTPLQCTLWPIIDPILDTFEQICNFCKHSSMFVHDKQLCDPIQRHIPISLL